MSTKKDTTDTSLEIGSELKKRPESKYNAATLRECIKEWARRQVDHGTDGHYS